MPPEQPCLTLRTIPAVVSSLPVPAGAFSVFLLRHVALSLCHPSVFLHLSCCQSPFPGKVHMRSHGLPAFVQGEFLHLSCAQRGREGIQIHPHPCVSHFSTSRVSALLPEVILPQVPSCGVADHFPVAWLS